MKTRIFCKSCGNNVSEVPSTGLCSCGGLFQIENVLTVNQPDIDTKLPGLWRYQPMIPVGFNPDISLGEGFTPLVKLDDLTYYKLDYLFPTGSFKDRGAAVLITKLLENGVSGIVEDSSGNAGAAIACYAARAGIECHVVVPGSIARNKIKQIESLGAIIHPVEGDREKSSEFADNLAEHYYYASHVYNPWFFEGTKTLAFELWEQMNFSIPDQVVVPVGNGTLVIGLYKGFSELMAMGLIVKIPAIIGIQAKVFNPLEKMINPISEIIPECIGESTIASGIAIKTPKRYREIIHAISMSSGTIISVSEEQIERALSELHNSGFYIEPTSAVVHAARSEHPALFLDKTSVFILTGNGLKTGRNN